jgi:hypothetical protein
MYRQHQACLQLAMQAACPCCTVYIHQSINTVVVACFAPNSPCSSLLASVWRAVACGRQLFAAAKAILQVCNCTAPLPAVCCNRYTCNIGVLLLNKYLLSSTPFK